MGQRTSQGSQQTQTTYLPPEQQTNANMLMQGARDFYNTGGPQFFPGQTYAGATGNELAARNMARGYSTGVGSALVGDTVAGDRFWLNPDNIYNPSQIPGFQNAQDSVTRQVTENLQRNILPSVRSNAISTGSLGGSRQGISEGLAIGETNKTLADTLAGMNMQAYNSGLSMYNSAANRAPQTYNLGLQPANTLGLIGGQERADEQQAIDANIQRFNFDQMRPLLNLQAFQSLTGTQGQYGGTTTSQGNQGVKAGSNPLQGVGLLMQLASMMPWGG